MKKFILALVSIVVCVSVNANTMVLSNGDTSRTIEIIIHKEQPKNAPRSVQLPQIVCIYDSGHILMQFTRDIGSVAITVTNQTTGEQWFDFADSADGYASIYTSDTEGDYNIFIETDSGSTYSGSFFL